MFFASVNRLISKRAAVAWSAIAASGMAAFAGLALADTPVDSRTIAQRLIAAYPGIVTGVDGNAVRFADGTTLPLDDGRGEKPFDAWLSEPDIEDMFRINYPVGAEAVPPPRDFDPGRARNAAFFAKVYGDCRKGGVKSKLTSVRWLPKKYGRAVQITAINGVADKLRAVSAKLDALPSRFDKYLFPIGGTYVCRVIAGTSSPSAHGYGISIDISTTHSHYWRWPKVPAGEIIYRNEIPMEIVSVFEKHGFIWGGRWYHHDTMHFEYRPELLPLAGGDVGAPK